MSRLVVGGVQAGKSFAARGEVSRHRLSSRAPCDVCGEPTRVRAVRDVAGGYEWRPVCEEHEIDRLGKLAESGRGAV